MQFFKIIIPIFDYLCIYFKSIYISFILYRLLAAKEGYVLTEQSMRGHFSAHKLAEIVVTVKDVNDGSPLQVSNLIKIFLDQN